MNVGKDGNERKSKMIENRIVKLATIGVVFGIILSIIVVGIV
jgi:hypothetical protein